MNVTIVQPETGTGLIVGATSPSITTPTLTKPTMSGTPTAEGQEGYDSTQKAVNAYGNGQLGTMPKVIAAGVGTQALTNSTTSDQDFTSLLTLPANVLFTNKLYRVSLLVEVVTGVSSVTPTIYLKLGSTKVYISQALNPTDSITRSYLWQFLICGRAAAGASAAVTTAGNLYIEANGALRNTVDQPVNLATNGTLAITPGVTYSGTGSTESLELQSWVVEELN